MGNMSDAGGREDVITRSEAERIIERAVTLEAADDNVISLDELRRIAAEVGISPETLSLAAGEVLGERAGGARAVPRSDTHRASMDERARRVIGAIGGSLALIPALALGQWTGLERESVLVAAVMIAMVLFLVLFHRTRGSVMAFLTHWIALCAALVGTMMFVMGGPWRPYLIGITVIMGLGMAITGTMLTDLALLDAPDDDAKPLPLR